LHDSHEYQSIDALPVDKVKKDFLIAKNNFYSTLELKGIESVADIDFYLYDDLEFDEDLNIDSEICIQLQLPSNSKKKIQQRHQIHMNVKAFYGALGRLLSWNQVLSGSLCLFYREPNVFFPEVLFALNFLVIPKQ